MIVKEILLSTATCLGREDIVAYLNGNTENVNEETINAVSVMVSLINIVLNELAATYIPMVKTEGLAFSANKFLFADLSENIIEVEDVFDDYGNKVNYKISGEYLVADIKTGVIKYHYLPKNYDLNDMIGYRETDVCKMTLVAGLAAEFSISEGLFDEAVMWHNRFVDGVSAQTKPKNVKTKSRCWA